MAGDAPTLSIVIRCFNEERHIGTLLDCIFQQTIRQPEVIVVDSGSTDGTLEVIRRFPAQLVRIPPAEFTFGYSLNQGCRFATGDFIVAASAHVVPCKADWLERLVEPFHDERIALVYGRQQGDAESKFSEQQVFAKQFPSESNLNQHIPFCNNANAAFRRSLWLEQPFDEALTGLEDLAWGKWAIDHGHRIAYSAEAAVIHIHRETAAQIQRRYMREAIALKRIVPDSHVTLSQFVALFLSNVSRDLLAAFRRGKLPRALLEILMFRSMQYWGTYRGMNDRSPLTHELIMKFYYPRPLRPGKTAPSPATRETTYDTTRR